MSASDILGPVDDAFYFVDTPQTPMNIGAVTIFEGQIAFDDLVRWIEARIYQAPLYQKRVVDTPLNLGQPKWIYDPNFEPQSHVFGHELDSPGTDEQLRVLAGTLISGMLDRSKPLWEVHLINGLQGNRTAVLFKVHHCMVDGLSAVELITLLLDLSPQPSNRTHDNVYQPPPLPTALELLASAVSREVPNKLSMLNRLGSRALEMGALLIDRDERRKTLIGLANLINDNVTPIHKLLINGSNTGHLTLAWTDFPLAEVKAIRAKNHCSINEVMITLLGTAIEAYGLKHGETSPQTFVRVLAPVDVRKEEEKGTYGNRIAVLPMDIPFGVSDPLERLRRVSEYSQAMKQSGLVNGVDMLLTLPSLALNVTQPFIWKAAPSLFALIAHTWCTNVVGPPLPIYLMGSRMLSAYGYFPLNASMGLACVIMSYNQRIGMTLIADAGIIPDVTELRYCLEAAYTSLREASGVESTEPTAVEPQPSASPVDAPTEPQAEAPLAVPVDTLGTPIPFITESPETTTDVPVLQPVKASVPDGAPALMSMQSIAQAAPVASPAAEWVMEALPAVPAPNGNKSPVLTNPIRFRIFSEAWAAAYRQEINNSSRYRSVSKGWEAGSLAFIMHAAPERGFDQASAVLLDLHRGVCRSACALSISEARSRSSFVLEGSYEDWIKVLTGQAQPITMIMRNKLALTKGSMLRLLPFTQSAQELVNCAQKISES